MKRGNVRSTSVEPMVESYLKSVGMRGYQTRKAFWKKLRERHGPIAEKVARAISAREEGDDVDVYSLKNKTLSLSIDITSQYCTEMYKEFLRWFVRRKFPKPRFLLDVGCDNGSLTCFYAILYPKAEVVGIDRCERGIACARQLASRLDLANVRFEGHDLLSLEGAFPDQSFDLIVSTTVFHEVVGYPEDFPVKIVMDLARRFDEAGIFVSMERWDDAAALARWIWLLKQAGLDVEESYPLRFTGMDGDRQMLPIVVARRNQRGHAGR
ncbi:MAG: methyltransferase domain-containing protein [Candidatus Methylomirabilales bacterium]